MRKFSFAFFVAVTSLFLSSEIKAQSDSLLKSNDIRILLNLMEVGPAMQNSLLEEIAMGRQNKEEDLPVQFWDEFEKEAMASLPAFVERLIPAYSAEFSHQEIKDLITIYQNPAMKKLNAVGLKLSEAGARAGEAWGEEIGLRVALRIDEQDAAKAATPAKAKAKE